MGGLVLGTLCTADKVDGGAYRIIGDTKRLGSLTGRLVRLFDRESGRVLRSTITKAPDYSFEFNNIAYRYRGYCVVEYDWPLTRSDPLNADITDMQTQEPMQ